MCDASRDDDDYVFDPHFDDILQMEERGEEVDRRWAGSIEKSRSLFREARDASGGAPALKTHRDEPARRHGIARDAIQTRRPAEQHKRPA